MRSANTKPKPLGVWRSLCRAVASRIVETSLRSGFAAGRRLVDSIAISDFPTFAEMRMDEWISLRNTLGFHIFGVPFDAFAGALGKISDEQSFGKRRGVLEIGFSFRA